MVCRAAKLRFLVVSGFIFGFVSTPSSFARMMAVDSARASYSALAKITALPNLDQCTHKTGRLWFTVTNYGVLGNQRNVFLRDCLTGGLTSSAEFPGGSNVEYLLQGALWIGGIVGEDTLTSIGNDGWVNIREMFPDADAAGNIIRRSARKESPHYSPEAVSDQDFIAVYYDTLTDPRLVTSVDPEDGKRFKPLGLKIEERSYSWAAGWGQDWVLLDYTITNIGKKPIKQAYVGIFMDPDIGKDNGGRATYLDDYCALQAMDPLSDCAGDTINVAYAYDNDGDPEPGDDFGLSAKNPTAALGVRLLRAGQALRPNGTLAAKTSFNWWVADSSRILDWGPQMTPGRASTFGGRGQPMGDAMRYYYLSNQESDYDQISSAINQNPPFQNIWLPPLPMQSAALDIANGGDSRFLLSAGPFDMDVGDSVPLTVAVFAGAGFHTDPANFSTNFSTPFDFMDTVHISAYKSHLDLSGLIESARMARIIFDNNTDTSQVFCFVFCNEYACNYHFKPRLHGDGAPDFKGPTPPPYPKVEFSTGEGEVTIRWFGRETETAADPVSGIQDFEGYSLQMSPDGVNYTIIGYFDRTNWRLYYLNYDKNHDGELDDPGPYLWEPAPGKPLTYEEIQRRYAVLWDTCLNKPGSINKPIDPNKHTLPFPFSPSPLELVLTPSPDPWCNPDTNKIAIRVRFCDHCNYIRNEVDTLYYFVPVGPNLGLDQVRMFPTVSDPDDDRAYWYQYKMTGLFPSQPVWFAVVPFDNGMVTWNQKIDP